MESLNKKTLWTGQHKEIWFEVVHWGIEREHNFEPMNDGQGCWNYYVYIPERIVKEKIFETIWLPEQVSKFTPESSERISYNYMNCPLNGIDFHCGITYYSKEGYNVKGHRVVKAGCDYSHLWDSERGFKFTLEEVVSDAKHTIDDLIEKLAIK